MVLVAFTSIFKDTVNERRGLSYCRRGREPLLQRGVGVSEPPEGTSGLWGGEEVSDFYLGRGAIRITPTLSKSESFDRIVSIP